MSHNSKRRVPRYLRPILDAAQYGEQFVADKLELARDAADFVTDSLDALDPIPKKRQRRTRKKRKVYPVYQDQKRRKVIPASRLRPFRRRRYRRRPHYSIKRRKNVWIPYRIYRRLFR